MKLIVKIEEIYQADKIHWHNGCSYLKLGVNPVKVYTALGPYTVRQSRIPWLTFP